MQFIFFNNFYCYKFIVMGTYISKIRVKQKNFYNSYGNHERLGPGKKKVKFGLSCERKLYDENLILLVCLFFETITNNHNNIIN
jgi:hypothetical protein